MEKMIWTFNFTIQKTKGYYGKYYHVTVWMFLIIPMVIKVT